jgi:hypothetical protein
MANTIEKDAKTIREALKNNCLYVYHVWGDGCKARVVNARTKKGKLQVKHLQQGVWIEVSDGKIEQS